MTEQTKLIMKKIQEKCQALLDEIDGNSCTWSDICSLAEPNQPNTSNNTELTIYAITKLNIDKIKVTQ